MTREAALALLLKPERPVAERTRKLPGRPRQPLSTYYWVIQRLADGATYQDIADTEGLSYQVVADLVSRARRVADLKTNYQLLAHCLRNGWID